MNPQSVSKPKLATMTTLFLAAFWLYGMYSYSTIKEVMVNGPYYRRIVQSKDIIADVLPPPEYLIETYLTAMQMLGVTDLRELTAYVLKIHALKSEYLVRHAYWESQLPDGDLKRLLLQESFLPAERMLDSLDRVFIPALATGQRAKAEAVLYGSIRKDYEAHRMWIDQVVTLAKRQNQNDEAAANVAVKSRMLGQIILGILLFVLLSICSWYWMRPSGPSPESPG